MIASEIQEYYIEVAVWLLVKLLATGLCREIGRSGPHLEMIYTQVLGIIIVNTEREESSNEIELGTLMITFTLRLM